MATVSIDTLARSIHQKAMELGIAQVYTDWDTLSAYWQRVYLALAQVVREAQEQGHGEGNT